MAKFGKWTSVIEDLPKEVGTYLIIGTFGFVHDRESTLCDHDEIAIGYYNPSFGWLSNTSGFKKANYWMELPSDKPNGEEESYKLYKVYMHKSTLLTVNAKSESEAIEEATIEFNDIEPMVKVTKIGG